MPRVQILVVEDQAIIANSIADMLQELGYVVSAIASSGEEAVRLACELCPDLVLMDIKLQGDMDGIDAALKIGASIDAPVIYLTAYSEEDMLRRAKVTRPAGYLLKPFEPRDLRSAIEIALYKHKMDRELKESEQQLQQVMTTVPEGVLLIDAEKRALLANPVAETYLQLLTDPGPNGVITHLGDIPIEELLKPLPEGLWHEVVIDHPTPYLFEVASRPASTDDVSQSWVLLIRDVTREREMQRYIQQQERLAAVGQLAAGVAHDFNNIMAVITLYAQMSLKLPGLPEKLYERLRIINDEAHSASALIQQILDFSRRGGLERRPVDLRVFLKEQVKLLRRTLPESISIDLVYENGEYAITGDLARLKQAFMNLAVYIRDRMPEGGAVSVELDRLTVAKEEMPPLPEMESGTWIRVQITDTGGDLAQDTLAHIFDPFFVEETAQESGLGLAQVYGIIASHDGYIHVTVDPDAGITFIIYLPALPVKAPDAEKVEPAPLARGHGELVLLVEDNPATRDVLANTLDYLGYTVVKATNGREALKIFDHRADEVRLVLSDVVMPEMGGIALLQALRERGATVKVILISGHPLENKLEKMLSQGLTDWLAKPPDLEQLATTLTKALHED